MPCTNCFSLRHTLETCPAKRTKDNQPYYETEPSDYHPSAYSDDNTVEDLREETEDEHEDRLQAQDEIEEIRQKLTKNRQNKAEELRQRLLNPKFSMPLQNDPPENAPLPQGHSAPRIKQENPAFLRDLKDIANMASDEPSLQKEIVDSTNRLLGHKVHGDTAPQLERPEEFRTPLTHPDRRPQPAPPARADSEGYYDNPYDPPVRAPVSPAPKSNNPYRTSMRYASIVPPVPVLPDDDVPEQRPGDVVFKAPEHPRFLSASPPFLFDGTPAKFESWKTALLVYVTIHISQFLGKLHIANTVLSACTPGARPHQLMTRLVTNLLTPGTGEYMEYDQIQGNGQTLNWILGKLARHFTDYTASARALASIERKQEGSGISTFLNRLDTARMSLHWDYHQIQSYLIRGMNPILQVAIANRLGKPVYQLSWHDVETYGPEIENEQKYMATLVAPTSHTPRVQHRQTTLAQKENVPNPTPTPLQLAAASAPPATPRPNRLSPEDMNIVRSAGACFKCFRKGHRSADCSKNREEHLSDQQRDFLLKNPRPPRSQ